MLLSITSPKLPISRKWAGSAAGSSPPVDNIDDVPLVYRLQTHDLTTENIPRITAAGAGESGVNQDYLYDSSNGRWVAIDGLYYFALGSEWGIYTFGGSLVYYDINGVTGSPADGTSYESAGGMSPNPVVSGSGVLTRRATLHLYSDPFGSASSKVGENVMLWRDGFDSDQVTQGNSMFAPTLRWSGDTPVIRFDGADDFMGASGSADFTAITLLVSAQVASRLAVVTGSDSVMGFGLDFSSNPILRTLDDGTVGSSSPVSANTFYVLTALYAAGQWRLYADGAEISSGSLPFTTFGQTPFYIGRDADELFAVGGLPWNGDMIAVMAYPAEHRLTVEAYQQTLKPSA